MDGRVLQVNISPGGVPKQPVERAWVGRDGPRRRRPPTRLRPRRAAPGGRAARRSRRSSGSRPTATRIEPGSVGENLTTTGIELSRLAGRDAARDRDGRLRARAERRRPDPCDVIKGSFRGRQVRPDLDPHPPVRLADVRPGRSSRARSAPATRSRCRRRRTGIGRDGLPRCSSSSTSVEREAWLAMWRAAAAAGYDVRIVDHGDLSAAASPDLPGTDVQPGVRPAPWSRSRPTGSSTSIAPPGPRAGSSTPAWKRAAAGRPWRTVASASTPPRSRSCSPWRRPPCAGLVIRPVDGPTDERAWVETYIAAFDVEPPIAEAWRAFEPLVARAHGYHQVLAELDGRVVARRRDADPPSRRLARRWRRAPGGARPRHPASADRASGARGGDGRLHAGHVHGQRRVGVRARISRRWDSTRSGARRNLRYTPGEAP